VIDQPLPEVPPVPEQPQPENSATPEPSAPDLDAPIEVVPPLTSFVPEPRGQFEAWLVHNLVPLLVILLALGVQIVSEVAMNYFVGRALRPKPVLSATDQAASAPAQIASLQPPPTVWLLLFGGTVVAYLWSISPDIRELLKKMFGRFAVRPLPALRLVDLLAAIAVFLGSSQILALAFLRTGAALSEGAFHAFGLMLNAVAFAAAILTGNLLARHRAGGSHGAFGLWPFWRQYFASRSRSLWADIGLGILAYPFSVLIVSVCLYANQLLLRLFNRPPDEHMLMTEMTHQQPPWVISVFFIMAVFGAALLEELLFRGLLYNVLRRYFGAVSGACAAALIFAVMHGIWSQVLGLFALALILTWLYDRTGRLVAGMALHATNNFVAMVVVFLLRQS
jgi:membrane protease YdiL (CAAX protease family)